jgi:ribonuclease G
MSREILIQTNKKERLVAIIENGRLDDFHIEVDRYQSLLGNVYKGKVESILPSINAAFVNIGQPKNGFLYLTDAANPLLDDESGAPKNFIQKIFNKRKKDHAPKTRQPKGEIPLKIGQEILVQVVKDPFGEKGARLTTHISLPGRFVVYMPYDPQTGVSKKIDNVEERQRLREILQSFTFAKTGGFIIRTASLKQGKKELFRDAKRLYEMWVKIQKKTEHTHAPALIYDEGELTWRIVRDYLTDKVDRLVIDSEEEYHRIREYVQKLVHDDEMVSKIEYYNGKVPLFESKKVMKDLQTIYDTHVYCRSGAYFVIEQTEGLIVIDVNSGKFKTNASPGEAAFMVNLEVVPELARQLRLRDVGGIIVIDFIDMTREEHKRKIIDAMQRALARDPAKTEVGSRISPLGLVEMTRARTGKTIESISFGKCPYCEGRGRVKFD